jgi:septal ring factor EnvC (AmiA/AmiB activator)
MAEANFEELYRGVMRTLTASIADTLIEAGEHVRILNDPVPAEVGECAQVPARVMITEHNPPVHPENIAYADQAADAMIAAGAHPVDDEDDGTPTVEQQLAFAKAQIQRLRRNIDRKRYRIQELVAKNNDQQRELADRLRYMEEARADIHRFTARIREYEQAIANTDLLPRGFAISPTNMERQIRNMQERLTTICKLAEDTTEEPPF